GRLADHPARNGCGPAGCARLAASGPDRRGLPAGGSLRARASAGPARLDHGGGSAAASTAARRSGGLAHQGPALVADGGRHGVESAAGRARLRAHLAHLLFLAEPVLERHEGRLLAPPLLEFAVGQRSAELPGGFLLELRYDLVVLGALLLLVFGHLDFAGRDSSAALRALFRVGRT